MRAQTIDTKEATGRVLCCTIFRPGGRKLLAKGHILSEEDVRILETEGLGQVWVTELEDGEVSEDVAVSQVASEMGCGCLEIRLAAGGRANLVATEDCCVLVDDELLKQINCAASIVIATSSNFSFACGGQRIATVKSAPFAVAQSQLEAVINILRERGFCAWLLPLRQAECSGSGLAADARTLPRLWMGSSLPGPWRPVGLKFSTTTNRTLRAVCGAPRRVPDQHPAFFFCAR
jgi:hypothetical protein